MTASPSPEASSSGYTLTLRPGQWWADAATLRPDVIGTLPIEQLHAKLGSVFDITGNPGPTLTLHGLPALDGLGAHMAAGQLIIHGQAGDDLGASMTGGVIHVHGRAGHRVGGPAANDNPLRQGMTGGCIVIHGDAGDHAGLRMRRGLIAITGQADAGPGHRMIAGTLAIGQGDLHHPGLEMQRGTILSLNPKATLHAGVTFAPVATFDAPAITILGLLLVQLARLGMPVQEAMRQGRWRLLAGDRLEAGKGELWQFTG